MFLCSLIYCVIGLSVTGLRKIRFNGYTPCRISTKSQFPNYEKPRFPFVLVDSFRLISQFLCSLIYCVIGLSVTGLRKIRFNGYTPCRISTKSQFPNYEKPRFPFVLVDSFRLISQFLCSLIYCVIGLSVTGLRKIRFNGYTPCRISAKNQFTKKPGFPQSA